MAINNRRRTVATTITVAVGRAARRRHMVAMTITVAVGRVVRRKRTVVEAADKTV